MAEFGINGNNKRGAADGGRLVVRAKSEQAPGEDASLFKTDVPGQKGPEYGKRKLRVRHKNEVSVYEEQLDEQYGLDHRDKVLIGLVAALVVAFVAAVLLPSGILSTGKTVSIAWFTENISSNISNLLAYFTGENPYNVMHYEFCRYLVVILAGAALGVIGGVYQSSMKNALASPTTLGVVSGGTLGAMLFVILCSEDQAQMVTMRASDIMDYYASLSVTEYLSALYGQAAFTLLGCFIVVAFVLAVSLIAGKGKISGVVMVVTGQVVTMVAASVMTLIRNYYSSSVGGDALKSSALQQVRSAQFSAMYTELDLLFMGVPIVICIVVILAMRMRMNALTFSDEEARSMGISTVGSRYALVGVCTLMTALVIAFCGSIGFVGFVVPHLTRRLVGPGFKHYIPATALAGALFMLLACFVSSFIGADEYGGVRMLTTIIGGVAFVIVAIRGRGRATSDEL